MAGGSFLSILYISLFLFATWLAGTASKLIGLSPIVAEIAVGVALGPNGLGFVPSELAECAAKDHFKCDDMDALKAWVESHCGASRSHCQASCENTSFVPAATSSLCVPPTCEPCMKACELARDEECERVPDIFSLMGQAGVALMIFESSMHFDLKEIKVIGPPALRKALIGTLLPIACGVGLTYAFASHLKEENILKAAFAAGVSLAPTSIGIALKLLLENGSLKTRFGQIIIAGAFLDDIFSLLAFQLLNSVGDSDVDLVAVLLKMGAGVLFIIIGSAVGATLLPKVVHRILAKVKDRKDASFQPRDNLLLLIMVLLLGGYATLTNYIGSHLWGCFVAGMSFAEIRRAQYVWVHQMKRITRWLMRLFFAGSIAFSIPIGELFNPVEIGYGVIMGLVACIATKLAAGIFMRELRWVIGWAMCGRAEFAYLIAGTAKAKGYFGSKLYVIVIWALLWATILAPFMFSLSLKRYNARRQKELTAKNNDEESRLSVCHTDDTHIHFRILIVKKLRAEDFDHEIHTFLHDEHLTVTSVHVRREADNFMGMYGVRARNVVVAIDFLIYLRDKFFKVFDNRELHVVFLPAISDADKECEMLKVSVVSNSDPHFLSTALARIKSAGLCVVQSSCEFHHPVFVDGLTFFPHNGHYVLSAICQPSLSTMEPREMIMSAAEDLKESLKTDTNHVFMEPIAYNPDPLHTLMRNEVAIDLTEAAPGDAKPTFFCANICVDTSADDIQLRSVGVLQPLYSSVFRVLDQHGLNMILCRQDHMPLAIVPTILVVVQIPDTIKDLVEFCADVRVELEEAMYGLQIPGTVDVSFLNSSLRDGVKMPCHLGEMNVKFGSSRVSTRPKMILTGDVSRDSSAVAL